uniref:Zinc finger protein ZFPM1/2 PR domain-containing protein n=1 Tax=Pan troglodytes TaxID=9598 RepID=A0A2I3TB74_PANTR
MGKLRLRAHTTAGKLGRGRTWPQACGFQTPALPPQAPPKGPGPWPDPPGSPQPGSPLCGVDELEPVVQDGQRRIRARLSLATGLSWGPFHGSVQTRASSPRQAEPRGAISALAPSVQTHRTR